MRQEFELKTKRIQNQFIHATYESSNVRNSVYDRETKELIIGFKSGDSYVYFDVPFDVYYAFERAISTGEYHYHNIRMNYKYRKL